MKLRQHRCIDRICRGEACLARVWNACQHNLVEETSMNLRRLAVLSVAAVPGPGGMACSGSDNSARAGASNAAGQAAAGATIDGIPCQTTVHLPYHVHAPLEIFADTQAVPVPANIGIVPGKC